MIEKLVARGEMEHVSGQDADGGYLLAEAETALTSAETLAEADPVRAYEIAYEAARHAATALLVQQGIRPRSRGGHTAIVEAVNAQFPGRFVAFGAMRARRNELEYPRAAWQLAVSTSEAREAIAAAQQTIESAAAIVEHLGLWR